MSRRGDPHIDWTSIFIVGAWFGFVIAVVLFCVFILN